MASESGDVREKPYTAHPSRVGTVSRARIISGGNLWSCFVGSRRARHLVQTHVLKGGLHLFVCSLLVGFFLLNAEHLFVARQVAFRAHPGVDELLDPPLTVITPDEGVAVPAPALEDLAILEGDAVIQFRQQDGRVVIYKMDDGVVGMMRAAAGDGAEAAGLFPAFFRGGLSGHTPSHGDHIGMEDIGKISDIHAVIYAVSVLILRGLDLFKVDQLLDGQRLLPA